MELPRVMRKGWPVALEMSEVVEAAPEVVWSLITDWENQDDWMFEARDFVVTSPQRTGIGVTAEATIAIGGISTRDEIRVAGWEENKRLAIEHLGWVSGSGEIHLTPLSPGRTHVFWREELYPPLGILGALGITAFKPLMRRIFVRDLGALATLAYARSRTLALLSH